MIFELLYNDIIVPGRFMLNKRAILGGTGSESRGRKGNRRLGRQPIARFFRAERGLALQRKAQSLIRPMETHQINNYLEVERADSIC